MVTLAVRQVGADADQMVISAAPLTEADAAPAGHPTVVAADADQAATVDRVAVAA